jgi:hypothetical protein
MNNDQELNVCAVKVLRQEFGLSDKVDDYWFHYRDKTGSSTIGTQKTCVICLERSGWINSLSLFNSLSPITFRQLVKSHRSWQMF